MGVTQTLIQIACQIFVLNKVRQSAKFKITNRINAQQSKSNNGSNRTSNYLISIFRATNQFLGCDKSVVMPEMITLGTAIKAR